MHGYEIADEHYHRAACQLASGIRDDGASTSRRFEDLPRAGTSSTVKRVVRFTPISAGLPPPAADEAASPAKDFWFGLYLVDPSAASVEVLGKVRGGPRTWTNLDSMSDFVEGFLESTDLKGRICVHVV